MCCYSYFYPFAFFPTFELNSKTKCKGRPTERNKSTYYLAFFPSTLVSVPSLLTFVKPDSLLLAAAGLSSEKKNSEEDTIAVISAPLWKPLSTFPFQVPSVSFSSSVVCPNGSWISMCMFSTSFFFSFFPFNLSFVKPLSYRALWPGQHNKADEMTCRIQTFVISHLSLSLFMYPFHLHLPLTGGH